VELSGTSFALSDLIGKPVCDSSGRRLGRAFEVRAHWEDGDRIVIDEILVGRGSLLKRLRGPEAKARGIRWESVIEVGERIVVRALAV
jgi:sporulation protein YlmC with PRC-barrel domain